MSVKLNVEGLFRSPVSWAKVNRELARALTRTRGVDVAVQPRRGFQWDRSFPLPPELVETPSRRGRADARLVFEFPPNLRRHTDASRLRVLSVYEASRLPPDWVDPLSSIPDRVLVPSRHAERVYRESGVPPEKLLRIPHGYSPETLPPRPAGSDSPDDSLRLVTLATPHHRKGLDLIEARGDLLENPSIEWRVHSPYEPDPAESPFWEDATVLDRLDRGGFSVTAGGLPEEEVARLLREADLCVQPSRSEGFGLVMLEAMACATPVLTSDWGGPLDFAGEGMIRVPGRTRPARRCQYHQKHPEARVFEPDPGEFRDRLEDLIADPDRLRKLGRAAAGTVRGWTWEKSARTLVDHLTAAVE